MRGKGTKVFQQIQKSRITPAYAGKRVPSNEKEVYIQDHPRLCGEKVPVVDQLREVRGSPPPMRGKVLRFGGCCLQRGITPAYAGKSFHNACQIIFSQDHPRLCGEKWTEIITAGIAARITPAYAGKSCHSSPDTAWQRDHPRLCGEKIVPNVEAITSAGSPPPMRGKAEAFAVADFFVGIPPAYAGKSTFCTKSVCFSWDHPRLCGEKSSNFPIVFAFSGSPPPMRGKVGLIVAGIAALRITPAYAGKSRRKFPRSCTVQDHPRLCGEKLLPVVLAAKCEGSPPPMRGKAYMVDILFHLQRITPAYAGKRTCGSGERREVRDHPRLCGEKLP